ncbi:MAG: hypothetical protein FWG73_08600 [Planctomycetaceae bacterium]|nr:hypothetical protein [Planctomycetaceae bacterium]
MKKFIFGTSLFIALVTAGCSNSQLHQSLLLHENRQLEDALYAASAQLADLRRENNALRKQQSNEFHEPMTRNRDDVWEDDFDMFTPFEMPRVLLPDEPSTTELPARLRESQAIPIWSPVR